jgi:AcrR family transcriptional regulator
VATQRERRTATKATIVDAALTLYLEHDSIEPSLDAVAERAGVAKATVLYHFESRLGLLRAVATRLYAEIVDRLGPIESHADPAAWITAYLLEGLHPTARVFQQVSDVLSYQGGTGIGRGLRSISQSVEGLGVDEGALIVAGATQSMMRQVVFGRIDRDGIAEFVVELQRSGLLDGSTRSGAARRAPAAGRSPSPR